MSIDLFIKILATVTLFEMMVAIGLGVTAADVAGVVRNGRLVSKALLANYVLFPAVTIALLLLFHPDPLVAAGFLIVAVCPGAPYGPPFTGLARGNMVISVGLMVILAGSSALVAPLLLHLLLPWHLQFLPPLPPESPPLHINPVSMLVTLLVAQLLPLCVGLVLRQSRPALAARLQKPANLLSTGLNLVLLGVILSAQFGMLLDIPLRAFGGMFALVAAGVAAGWLLGGPGHENRTAVAVATAVRNVGVGLVIATVSFPGTQAVTAATAFGLFQTLVMALVALAWGRWGSTPGAQILSSVVSKWQPPAQTDTQRH
jgi:BASS family bile acid:Na+ symporter